MEFAGIDELDPAQLAKAIPAGDPETTQRAAYELRKGESFTLLGHPDGMWTRSRMGEPPDYANGILLCSPDLSAPSFSGVLAARNLAPTPDGLRMRDAGNAELTYERTVPFNIPSVVVWATFDRRSDRATVSLDLSRNTTSAREPVWDRVWQMKESGVAPVCIDLRPWFITKAIHYGPEIETFGYRLRFVLNADSPADIAVRGLRIATYTQHHGPSVPRLRTESNTLHCKADAQPGPVKVTWAWRETGGFAISDPTPTEGQQCTLTARATNRGKEPARNIVVRFEEANNNQAPRPLTDDVVIRELLPGRSATVSVPWSAPTFPRSPYASDRYQYTELRVCVDPESRIPEADEFNNEAVMRVHVRQQPDLVITAEHIDILPLGAAPPAARSQVEFAGEKTAESVAGVSFSFVGSHPERLRVRAVVRNACHADKWLYVNGTPAKDVVVRFYDGDPEAGGHRIGRDQLIPLIRPAEHGWAEVIWNIRAFKGSVHQLFVVVDPENRITESDESPRSNSASVTVKF